VHSFRFTILQLNEEKTTKLTCFVPLFPSAETVIPDEFNYCADWYIGNHADEVSVATVSDFVCHVTRIYSYGCLYWNNAQLVPYIPVMATRTSRKVRFLVIPCCAWDFDRRFTKKGAGGRYKVYCDYIEEVSKSCGFAVERDMLCVSLPLAFPQSRNNIADVNRCGTNQDTVDKECGDSGPKERR
jgi:hypothetical protein